MGKIRNAKPKKINDFKKVKAKVGKQVSRGPTTVINVKSKRIVLPTQVNASIEPVVEESSKINQLLRQFHHHSVSHRISALEDMNELLSKSTAPEMHVALVLPSILELLFDEDKESRQNLLKLIKNLLERCPRKDTYETIAPIITTYSCSGLTSLTKGIRLDSLHLLNMFLSIDSIRPIFQPHVDKLLGHVHHVLAAPSQINTAVTFNVATKSPSATAVPKKTKEQKKDNTPSLFQTSYILTSLQVISNLLLLLRYSLPLESLEENTWNPSQYQDALTLEDPKSHSSKHSLDLILFQNPFRRESLSGSRSTHVSLESQSTRLELLKSIESTISSYWNLSTNGQAMISTSPLSETYQILLSLALVSMPISAIFLYYVNSTSVSFNDRPSLMSHHFHLFQELFKAFPYQSAEGMVAPSGSTLEAESKRRVETLNMILCESSFISSLRYFSFQTDLSDELRSSSLQEMLRMISLSSTYLSHSVDTFHQKLQRQLSFQQKTNIIMANTNTKRLSLLLETDLYDQDQDQDQDQEEREESLRELKRNGNVSSGGGGGGSGNVGGTLSESLLRLFRCLSYQSQYMISCKHNVTDFTNQLTLLLNQFSSLLNQFLFLLHSFNTATLSHPHPQSPRSKRGATGAAGGGGGVTGNSKEISQLLFSIERILLCSWNMIRQDDLWDSTSSISSSPSFAAQAVFREARNQSLFGLLENICKIPQVLSSWIRSQGSTAATVVTTTGDGNQDTVHSILRQVCDILHIIVTRGGEAGGEGEENSEDLSTKQWKQQLNQIVCQTIVELFQPDEPSTASSSTGSRFNANVSSVSSSLSFYLTCHQSYRQNWLNIWFYCDFQSMRNEMLMNLLELLCSPEITSEDQSHFFSLLYLKRFEFSPHDLVTLVMTSFDCQINSLSISVGSSAPTAVPPALTSLSSFQLWSQAVAHLFYLCSPSAHSFAIINIFFPQLKALLPSLSHHHGPVSLSSHFPVTYFNAYLTSALFSSTLRRYKISNRSSGNCSSFALPPPVVSHSSSPVPAADQQQSLGDFLTFFIDALAQYLLDNSTSSRTLLQSGWENMKHHHTDLAESSSSSFQISNEWLLDLLQTQWNLPIATNAAVGNGETETDRERKTESSSYRQVDLWEELLKRLGCVVMSWGEGLKTSEGRDDDMEQQEHGQAQREEEEIEKVASRCVYLLSNLFEMVQHLKTIEKLSQERMTKMAAFLTVVQSHCNLTSQIDEYVSDMVRYMN